jgi:hypothetical protein
MGAEGFNWAEYSSILVFRGYNTHASTNGNAIVTLFANKD